MKIAVLCGLVGCSALAAAADEELPDLEFLEYLGSWEESDEEWLLFDAEARETAAQETPPQSESSSDRVPETPVGKESTELEKNES